MMKRKTKTTLKRVTSIPTDNNNTIIKSTPNVLIKSFPEEIHSVESVPAKDEIPPFIQGPNGHLEFLNADFDGSFKETSFFVPILDKTKSNILTGANEPYSGIVKETFEQNIDSATGNRNVYHISNMIGTKAENYFVSILRTNTNIILYNGLISLILKYAVCDHSVIYDLYTQIVLDDFGTFRMTHIKSEFMRLIVDDHNNMLEYQQNRNELQKIMEVNASIRYKIATNLSSLLYNFINNIVFGGYIDITRLNLDILNDFEEKVVKDTVHTIPMEEIRSSAPSLVSQYLLELLNNDMYKIIEISDITFMTVVNSILHDMYITKASNIICINPFKDTDEDDIF